MERSSATARIAAGISAEEQPARAAATAARVAAAALEGSPVDMACVFASGAHPLVADEMLEAIHAELAPAALIGCAAGGVLANGRELETGSAVVVWAAAFDGNAHATAFHALATGDPLEPAIEGLPALDDASGLILLADPYTFPADAALAAIAEAAPAVPVLGGLASARPPDGPLFVGEAVHDGGAAGVALTGVEMLPCVSQGAAPFGRELTITAAEGNLIHELAGRPAVQAVEQVVGELSPREQTVLAGGLLIGIVIDPGKPEYGQGDFLVRGILGADRESGSLAVGAAVSTGQVVRLHARDAASADEDLRRALRLRVEAMAGASAAGALLFSCNGRGAAMFGVPDHDATAVRDELGGAPAGGFFAAGEIGPVGGRNFLHGFTATIAVFQG